MQKVIAINGSPRKNANTATLLNKALEGANSVGAQVELINLIDLDYKGCISCFACQRKGTKFIGKCANKDGLTPILEKAMKSNVILLGSPIYFGDISSLMRAFLERFMFMNHSYDNATYSTFTGSISAAFIYTMGVPEDMAEKVYGKIFETNTNLLKRFNGQVEQILAPDSYQFDDYSKYATSNINLEQKIETKNKLFPIYCEQALAIGKKLASEKK